MISFQPTATDDMVFSDTEKGRRLAKIWDRSMERLYKSGKLQKMYSAYEDEAY